VHGTKVFTIGFTKKTAVEFFEKLRAAGIKRVLDVRLNNRSQLAGFSKRGDLPYFLEEILGVDYIELPQLAPTKVLRDGYRKGALSWNAYECGFNKLMKERCIQDKIDRELLDGGCLLCSEPLPDNCHRRLVAEYFQRHWQNLVIEHIV